MNDCVFCKITVGQIPAKMLYQDNEIMIFKDIAPRAKIHLVAVPINHYALLEQMHDGDEIILGNLFKKIANLKNELGLEEGYRLIINQGKNGGQEVQHLHVHILGGQMLQPHRSHIRTKQTSN